jgi:transcriptional regulator with PAS, ATPase and Fis domain
MVLSMSRYLVSWVGMTDLKASEGALREGELGPIGQAITKMDFDRVVLIGNYEKTKLDHFKVWLKNLKTIDIELNCEELSSPTDLGEIYQAVIKVLEPIYQQKQSPHVSFHLSPGTPAMAVMWILLSQMRYEAELIESSKESGVKITSIPFDISAEFIPDILNKSDQTLERLSEGLAPSAPEFVSIIHQSPVMQKVVARARRVAPRSIPVLIEGESGTGKELFARAIHQSSPRKDSPFICVNCGAIPSDLVQSELFGHKKGSFTGAIKDRDGHFLKANGGTLFLDEIGELSLDTQVKLLRAIQESEVVPVGSTDPVSVDIRIISATNRCLLHEVQERNFREDLYYRIAVASIKLPPLREREGDIKLLIDRLVEQVNEESKSELGYKHKKVSIRGKKIMLKHHWPGNVRELLNTIRSAAVWSDGGEITEDDVKDALLVMPHDSTNSDSVLNQDVSQGIDLDEIISNVERHYLSKAMEVSSNNKSKAAKLLGFKHYQTVTNKLRKEGLE